MKRILTAVAPFVLAAGAVVAAPAAAHAAGGPCTGEGYKVLPNASHRWYDSAGNPLATEYMYAKGGDLMYNTSTCAVLYAEGSYYNVAKYMGITLCNETESTCDTDHGTYKEYAGPVHVTYGGCGHVNVQMKNPAGTVILKATWGISCD
jgi:hypothetical protein